jgi:cytochrome c-type biogenesis protein
MEITFWIAFTAGLLSFLSPCILPIAPGYLGIISGTSLANLKTDSASKRRVLWATIAFILGFSAVFISLGIASSFLGQFLLRYRRLIAQIGGLVVIVLGLHQAGWLPISWLYKEKKLQVKHQIGIGGAFLTGLAFSLGWTPCISPILGSILTLAGSQGQVSRGILLLTLYSLGLAVPFLLLAIGFEQISRSLNRLKVYIKYFEWASGILLIAMGLLLLTGSLTTISSWFSRITGGWSPENLFKKP